MATAKKKGRTVFVKLYGGCMDGRIVEIPQGAETYHVGSMFTYTYAGREGRQIMFAVEPKTKMARRFILWYVGKHGKDPRIENVLMRQSPVRRDPTVPTKRGKAARARRARKVAC